MKLNIEWPEKEIHSKTCDIDKKYLLRPNCSCGAYERNQAIDDCKQAVEKAIKDTEKEGE